MFDIMNSVSKAMRRGVFILAALIFVLVAFGVSNWVQKDRLDPGEVYVSDHGHTITGKFLERYNQVENPLQLYGFPITGQFTTVDGKVVQYFDKVRFEQAENGEVKLTKIGPELLAASRLGEITDASSTSSYLCEKIPDTEFQVCFDFLEFFEKYGGVDQFGKPVSNQIFTGTKFVQYFEYMILEFHAERPPGQKIVVDDAGRSYFDFEKESKRHLVTARSEFIAEDVLSLEVNAFIHRDPSADDYMPTLYAIVQDQRQIPLKDVSLDFIVHYADGKEESFGMPSTNGDGFSKMVFPVSESQPGIVELSVRATYNNLEGSTKTSFRIWY